MDMGYKFGIEYPVYQIILILEVVLEAFPVHAAAFTDIVYIDFLKWLLLHQGF